MIYRIVRNHSLFRSVCKHKRFAIFRFFAYAACQASDGNIGLTQLVRSLNFARRTLRAKWRRIANDSRRQLSSG
jgi:hypothetical protein